MARTPLIAAAVLWAGCSAAARLGVTLRSTATEDPSGAAASSIAVDRTPPFTETTVQQQLQALRGLTVDEARQQLRGIGHDGPVKVLRLYKHRSGCAPERVCEVVRGRVRDLHDEVQLWLNPRLDIAAPEP